MFDARQLLEQVMASVPGGGGAGADAPGAQRPTGAAAPLMTGALAGGVLGLIAGNKGARKLAGKTAGAALQLGGLAALAAVGYTAWQRHKGASTGGFAGASAGASAGAAQAAPLQLPPADSGFAPDQTPRGADALARGVLVAMIQGAKADGHIDAREQARIFEQVEALGLDSEAKAFVMDELAAPRSLARVSAHATTPEVAAELYAASLMAMDPDAPAERAYLTDLGQALGLEPAFARQIEDTVRTAL